MNRLSILYRRFKKQGKLYLISLVSLSLSLSVAFLLLAYVHDGSNYDSYNTNIEELYILRQKYLLSDDSGYEMNQTPPALADHIKEQYPEVSQVCLMAETWGDYIESEQADQYYEPDGFFADSTVFDLFTYEFISGNANTALSQSGSIVLSNRVAQRLFPKGNALGQMVTVSKKNVLTVTGVYKDLPYNMHIRPSYLCSFSLYDETVYHDYRRSITNQAFKTYAIINKGSSISKLNSKVKTIYSDFEKETKFRPYFQLISEETAPGDQYHIYIAAAVLLLLLSACNYVNTATIGFANQLKELGVRQILGARRLTLIRRLFTDTVVLGVLVLTGATLITYGFLPYFNRLSGTEINIKWSLYWKLISVMILFLTITLISGVIIPFFRILSDSISPVLKGETKLLKRRFFLQQSLLVFQFIISISFLVFSFVMYKQMNYVQHKELGFDTDGIVFASAIYNGSNDTWASLLKERLEQKPGIKSVSYSMCIPFFGNSSETIYAQDGKEGISVSRNWTSANYFETFGISILQGQTFRKNGIGKDDKCVITSKTAKLLGFAEPIGKWIEIGKKHRKVQVIGVINDYEHFSIYNESPPMIFYNAGNALEWSNKVAVSYDFSVISVEAIKDFTANIIPDLSFEYQNFEDVVDKERGTYDLQSSNSLFMFFTLIAILISLLGLYNVVAINTESRTKEIGIRKVTGAQTSEILWMFNKNVINKITVSFLVACPIAYHTIRQWINHFAYQTSISWWIFLLAGLVTMLIVILTVSLQSLKTARKNPIKSLRYE